MFLNNSLGCHGQTVRTVAMVTQYFGPTERIHRNLHYLAFSSFFYMICNEMHTKKYTNIQEVLYVVESSDHVC